MKDQFKTKQVLIQELASLKRRIKELEQYESERKRDEEALRRAEENFRRSLDDSPLGIRIVTIDGETIYANRAILDIYSYEDLKTIPIKKRYTPESYAEYKIRREKRKRGDYVPSEYEISIIRKDGEVRNLQVYRKEILWDGERQFQVTYQDITDRKRAEEELRESEEKYRYLVKYAPTGIYEVDLTARKFLSVNDAMCQYTGYTREEFLSLDPMQFLTEESQKSLMQRHAKVLAGEPVQDSIELQIKRKNGSDFWALLNSRYPYEPDNRIIATGIVHDITERKIMEQALRESEEKYRTILENIEEGYHEVNLPGRFTFFNDSFQRIMGYSREELMGMSYKQYAADEENARKIFKAYNRVYRTGEPLARFEWDIIRKDGFRKTLEVSASLIKDSSGNPQGFRGIVTDITERKRAEEELKKAETRYRIIFENAMEGIYQSTPDGRFLQVNPAMARIYGYDSPDDMKHSVTDIAKQVYVNPDDRKYLKEILEKNDHIEKYEYQVRKKNGDRIWVSNNARVVRDNDGHILYYEGLVQDITERKQVEEALRKSEHSLKRAQEIAHLGSWELDLVNNRLSWSDEVYRIFGIQPQEFGATYEAFLEAVHPDDRAAVDKAYSGSLREGRDAYEIEHRVVQKSDGGVRIVHEKCEHVRDESGRIIRSVGMVHDITERKLAEEKLREAHRHLDQIIDFLPDATGVIDADSKVIAWNRAMEQMTGVPKVEMIGKGEYEYALPFYGERRPSLIDLALLPDIELEKRGYNIAQRSEDTIYGEVYVPNLDGGKGAYLHGAASRLRDSAGNIVGAIESVRDITDRKLAEEEKRSLQERLQRAEKMEALGTLAGGVAHDLNNVLGVVIGYSELLLMDADKSSSISPGLVKIMNGGQKAAAIVQDLLTLARRGVSGREVLNLNKIIADCQKSPEFEKLYSYHSAVRIKTDLEPDLLNVSGSSVHLGKTLFNLVSNATEAMPKGGILTIKTANQYLDKPIQGYDEVREGDYVVLSVSDTGEGIPASDLKRIFEPFYTKKVMGRSGTGLGLAVVWGTVKDHNGYINVDSEEGKGSTFTIYFPVTREDITAEAATISISEYMGKGESILIVDDVKDQRDLAAGMLRKLNYNVSSVSNGEESIAYLKEHKIDLMVLDMIMDPGMDGLDTYRSVLEIYPQQKAIIVSGFSETERVITAQSLGAGAYVRKPYVIEKLGLAVKKELNRK